MTTHDMSNTNNDALIVNNLIIKMKTYTTDLANDELDIACKKRWKDLEECDRPEKPQTLYICRNPYSNDHYEIYVCGVEDGISHSTQTRFDTANDAVAFILRHSLVVYSQDNFRSQLRRIDDCLAGVSRSSDDWDF